MSTSILHTVHHDDGMQAKFCRFEFFGMHVLLPGGTQPEFMIRAEKTHDTKRHHGFSFTRKCIHDAYIKSKAVDLLSLSIPSIDRSIFASYIFSELGRERRIHTWGIYTSGKEQDVIAVVVFRKHAHISLIELMWIAIDANYRGEGYGTDMLQYLFRDWYEGGSFDYITTFSDVSAVGFFERFGFQASVPFPRDLYDPWIDKYSHSRLLCLPLRRVNHLISYRREHTQILILVCIDNAERFPSQTWVEGIILVDFSSDVLVQYPFSQRVFQEILSVHSHRLKVGPSQV